MWSGLFGLRGLVGDVGDTFCFISTELISELTKSRVDLVCLLFWDISYGCLLLCNLGDKIKGFVAVLAVVSGVSIYLYDFSAADTMGCKTWAALFRLEALLVFGFNVSGCSSFFPFAARGLVSCSKGGLMLLIVFLENWEPTLLFYRVVRTTCGSGFISI